MQVNKEVFDHIFEDSAESQIPLKLFNLVAAPAVAKYVVRMLASSGLSLKREKSKK